MQALAVPISLLALAVSIFSLVFLATSVLRKTGQRLRGSLIECSSHACEDKFFSKITIENLKDKSAVIFKVYVKFGHNIYLVIQDFGDEPLILKPYEVFTSSYGPLDYYSTGTDRVRINKFFNQNTRRRIILSTSEGKYSVKPKSKIWSPIPTFFKNNYTGIINPVRSKYDGVSYGGNALFIVELVNKEHSNQIFAIYPGDHRSKKFKNFQLTEKSISNEKELKTFLKRTIKLGKVSFTDFKIHDVKKWNEENRRQNTQEFEAEHLTWFRYHIIGRFLSKVRSLEFSRKNKKTKKQAERKLAKKRSSKNQETSPVEDTPQKPPSSQKL